MASSRERDKRENKSKKWSATKVFDEQKVEATVIQLPEGVEFYKPKVGKAKIDVVPSVLTKDGPWGDENMEAGFFIYQSHGALGQDGKRRYVCLATWKKPCPICQHINLYGNQMDPKLVQDMRQKRRLFLCVVDLSEKEKTVKVWDAPWGGPKQPWFGQMLQDKVQTLPERYENFFELKADDGGKTLLMPMIETSVGDSGGKAIKPNSIEMLDREEDYPTSFLKNVPHLDGCIIEHSYSELKKLLSDATIGGGSAEQDDRNGEEEERPAQRNRRPAPKDEEDEEPEESEDDDEDLVPAKKGGKTAKDMGLRVGQTVLYEDEECMITKICADGKSVNLKELQDEDNKYPAVPLSDIEIPEEEEEPAPKKAPGKKNFKTKEEDEEDESEESEDEDDSDSDWDDDDEKPVSKKGPKVSKR